MIKLQFPLAVTLTLLIGGCAQPALRNSQSLSAEAAHFGVSQDLLRSAGRAGYSPRIRHGKTCFCSAQTQTFSYIPTIKCLDPAHMTAQLQLSGQALRDLQQRVATGSAPSRP